MRVVDIGAMIGPWPLQKLEFETAAGLVEKMDHYGIDEAYAYSSYAARVSPLDGNYMLMEQLQGYEDRIHPCWVVVPTWDLETGGSLEEELKKYRVRLVRLLPSDHSFSPEPWVCGDLYEMLQRNGIPVLLNQTDVTAGQIHAICSAYPDLPVILTQCEYTQNRNIYKLLELHPNFYLEIATYYIYDGLEDVARKFGAERMIFGSRMPFQEGAAALGMTLLADLTQEEKALILAGNADRLVKGGKA